MIVRVNDAPRDVGDGTTVAELLAMLEVEVRAGVAVAIDDDVVPRSTWPTRALREGDRVIVLRAAAGG